ncbi:MAG: hypothetical protein JNL57_08970 [Bacteroidetes bacterium]|nr:hypothetical protein [Bacteroidota bacterium]
MSRYLFLLFLLPFSLLRGQAGETGLDFSALNAENAADIFKAPGQEDYFGVFDSSQFYFKIHTADFKPLPQDYRQWNYSGKTWHRGMITPFQAQVNLENVMTVSDLMIIDTADFGPRGLQLYDSLYLQGWLLQVAHGHFILHEDSSFPHSGYASGEFAAYFLYSRRFNQVIPVPKEMHLYEPNHICSGWWFPFKSESELQAATPLFWSSLEPIPVTPAEKALPDYRWNAKREVTPGNILRFKADAELPLPGWYRK